VAFGWHLKQLPFTDITDAEETSATSSGEKWAKDMNRWSSTEDTQMAREHRKRCSAITDHQGECKSNHNEIPTTSHPSGWLLSKN